MEKKSYWYHMFLCLHPVAIDITCCYGIGCYGNKDQLSGIIMAVYRSLRWREADRYLLISMVVSCGCTTILASPCRGRHTNACDLFALGGLRACRGRVILCLSSLGCLCSRGSRRVALQPRGCVGSTCILSSIVQASVRYMYILPVLISRTARHV